MTAEIDAADADHLRMVTPVLADYVAQIAHGANLSRLKRIARREKAGRALALIDALAAAHTAAKRLGETAEEPKVVHDPRAKAIAFNAVTRVATGEDWVRLQIRDAIADAVLDDLASHGYVITYVGGAE